MHPYWMNCCSPHVFDLFVTVPCSTLLCKSMLTWSSGIVAFTVLPYICTTLLLIAWLQLYDHCYAAYATPLGSTDHASLIIHQPLSCCVASNRLPSALALVQAYCYPQCHNRNIYLLVHILGGAILVLLRCIGWSMCGPCMVVPCRHLCCVGALLLPYMHCVILCIYMVTYIRCVALLKH